VRRVAAALLALAGCATPAEKELERPFRLAYEHDFTKQNALDGFTLTDPKAWRLSTDGGVASMDLVAASAYEPKVRSPKSLAILHGFYTRDFDLEVDVMSTAREYDHRDLCLVFGWLDEERFYYAHLATKPDPHAHNVFVVDHADRVALAPVPASGVAWKDGAWHRLKLERRPSEGGAIRVFFDGALVLEAKDARFPEGRVGVGSFDDTGRFANLRLYLR